ncbi:hypothetical protein RN001_003736 [Aquatica leii]|uniref:Uncharacterized protein n=1 Tax=Aquatica leii TaxID=1421715 RepID=A0AAN7QBX1_9COLE|nr:hypothetical protein RN001_003736 [Aquatica leii]
MDDNDDRTENIATADDEAEAGQTILNNADISDEDEQDIEIFSDHDTVSDFEYLSDQENIISGDNKSKDESTIDLTSKRSKLAWYGKDNTKWAKEAPKKSKVKPHNLLRILPGPRGPVRNNPPSCPMEAWKQFITDDMLNVIVKFTNDKIHTVNSHYGAFRRRKNFRSKFAPTFTCATDKIEIEAFIEEKTELYKTGGGSKKNIPTNDLLKSIINEKTVEDFNNPFDGDQLASSSNEGTSVTTPSRFRSTIYSRSKSRRY